MQRKIFFYIVSVLLIGVIICGALSARMLEINYSDDIKNNLVSNMKLTKEFIGEAMLADPVLLDQYLNEIRTVTNARITVIDASGKVLADTESNAADMDNHLNRQEVKEAIEAGLGLSKRYSDTLKVNFQYAAIPIHKDGTLVGILRLSKPLYEIQKMTQRMYLNVLIAVLAGALIASFLGYKISENITMPIKEITYTATRIARGQLDKRINLKTDDEIAILADAINHMASTLSESIGSLQDKNAKLEAFMSSVVNGIIAIDSNERILFINPIAARMLNIQEKDVTGKHFLQAVRNNQIDNYLKEIIKQNRFFDVEIVLDYPAEKILKLYTNPIKYVDRGDLAGIIITIQDITELRKLERMRTEFVANVSHELKTPLTSIKGFVETLKSGALEDKEDSLRFLNIIEDEAERLYRLISDILSLSELEHRKHRGVPERIDVRHTVQEVISILKSQADKKGIQLETDLQESIDSLYGDPDRFKQMLINLVDNAVKYTPDRGKVNVEAYQHVNETTGEKRIIIDVIDNGIGIAKEHVPRLFERFYRIDKARSRRVGGTGLGLAIVKHIVLSFDGEIEVESEVGKGTRFTVSIPIEMHSS